MRWLIVAASLLLVACTPVSRAFVNQAVETIKDAEDSKARLALQAPCAITLGAKNRVLSESEKRHAEGLCGGNVERPVTAEDLQRVLAQPVVP